MTLLFHPPKLPVEMYELFSILDVLRRKSAQFEVDIPPGLGLLFGNGAEDGGKALLNPFITVYV
jgi:hypothetical protein